MTEIEYLKKYLPEDKLEEGLRKYNLGIPVQYIVGNVDFYGNIIEVNENVLIPRFETEELVDRVIKRLKDKIRLDVVDLGTGSGCIAIALAKNLDCVVDAVDISASALEVAKRNAINNNVDINFYLGDMLNVLKKTDLIITRAGASTIAEITAIGIPAIMIPSPYVTHNHQEKNARVLEKINAAKIAAAERTF